MQTLNTTRRLTNALILLTAIVAGQVHAKEAVQVAENGSERALQHSRKQHPEHPTELVENGSERTLQHRRKLPQTATVELAETAVHAL
jgi:hypothetical protein